MRNLLAAEARLVERLVEVSVKLLVYEDFWRNLFERSLIVVRFWIFSSRESLPCLPSQERSGFLGLVELFELYILFSRIELCVVPEKSNAIIGVVTTGFECLPPSCDVLMGSEDHGPMISPVDTPCMLFVLRLDLVFVFLLLCCLGLCYQFAGSSGNQAGPSGMPVGRSPFP
ncbi:hypothetical protein F511_41009 [Dorcoceras hygrometricum]|uniref:Uncharacterized protein n=1 Tax=Dorcoceras hygrometricum TaxID=472368 RepID=A0A2Z7BVJ9_9LAMI|nr:hypothetical protein F511_41009 [Dorcoceras hygrometricum]